VTSNGDARRYLETQADLVLFLGASFNERTSYLWDEDLLAGKRLVQVDRDADQLGKVFCPDVAIQGDLRAVVEALLQRLAALAVAPKGLEAFERHRAEARNKPSEMSGEVEGVRSRFELIARFYQALAERFPSGAVVFDDNIVFAQSYFPVSDRNHYYPNSGISSLGHALPAAIGAYFAGVDGPVFAVLGDGGFQMCAMELMTAVNYAVPLNVVVINNGTMGLIRKNQFQQYDGRYIDCDFVNPDFGALAGAFGIRHFRLERPADADTLFRDADLGDGIGLIELVLDRHAFPTYLSTR
jgi:acetolactate synthase-1/2/3 large subunit